MFSLHRVVVLPLLFVFGSSATCFAEPASLTIYIHDDAVLNSRDLTKTISELERILRSAGVEPNLCVCRKGSEARCTPGLAGSKLLDVRILPASARRTHNVGRPPLGHSIVDERGGVYAVLFLDTIRREASAADVPLTIVLAYAAAHEIGHLLLGASAHSRQGLMKANWERSDLIAMYQRTLRFNEEQCRRIAERCKPNLETKNR